MNGHPGAAGTDGLGAMAFPPSTIAFVDASTDPTSTGWANVRSALGRIPGWAKIESKLTAELAKPVGSGKASYAKDIKPWLGNEVAGGFLGLSIAGGKPSPEAVLFIASKDDGAAEKSLAADSKRGADYKGYHEYAMKGGSAVGAVGNGAVLVATDLHSLEVSIDAREGGAKLADDPSYKATLGKLPADGVVVGYLRPAGIAPLITTALAAAGATTSGAAALPTGSLGAITDALRSYTGIGVALYGDANGVGVAEVSNLDPAHPLAHVAPPVTLIDHAPANAISFLDTNLLGGSSQLADMLKAPQVAAAVASLEGQTGLSIANDVLPLLTGELGVVVTGGAPIGGSLLLRPTDVAAGATAIRKITAVITKLQPSVQFSPLPGGLDGQQTGSGGSLFTWVKGSDVLAVGYNTGGAVPAGGLATSARYARAAADAHVGASPTMLLWIDPSSIAGMPAVSATQATVLRSIGGLIAWSAGGTDATTGGVYLDIPPAG